MSTLLLRLAGPMQSWGTQSRFTVRDTGQEPSQSGVIGLLCAALGKPREEKPGDRPTLESLARLRMGVRVDFPGAMQMDYHTAGGAHRRGEKYGVVKADGSPGEAVISHRYYLADADFLVGLESDDDALLAELHRALAQPVWQLCLGRKAFVPGIPVFMRKGLKLEVGLEKALTSQKWPRDGLPLPPEKEWPEKLRLVLQVDEARGEEVRRDVPLCFETDKRQFALRYVITRFKNLVAEVPIRQALAHEVSQSGRGKHIR